MSLQEEEEISRAVRTQVPRKGHVTTQEVTTFCKPEKQALAENNFDTTLIMNF
jgi:hypothetical protein